jgi:predicted 2-oxoglutarate/Fe(II)-dependent dioxygenase YbiX
MAGPTPIRHYSGAVPEAAFFTRFGIFADHEFLDAATCARVVAEMRQRGGRQATVSLSGEHVDEDYRRTTLVDISDETRALVEDRIRAALPAIARHFDEQLGDIERAQFLLYREGDHFRRHTDSHRDRQSPEVTPRRISAVVFLNAEGPADRPDSYGGGQLTFYGLMGDRLGLPLAGRPGLLVAFRSDLVHAVTPVTHGERCTVVSWFR